MKKVIVAVFIGLTAAIGTSAQAPATLNADRERELFTQDCVGCHNEKAKTSGIDSSRKLTIDSIRFQGRPEAR